MSPITPRQAAALIRSLRWPKGPVCPYCGALDPLSAKRDYRGHLTYHRCWRCRRFFSELTGTVMERSRIDLPTWFHFIYHIDRGLCVCHLADRSAYSRTACQRLAYKIRRSELCRQIRAILETRVLRARRSAQVRRRAFESEFLNRIEWDAESPPSWKYGNFQEGDEPGGQQ